MVDMGGFATNAKVLFEKPGWRISDKSRQGHRETDMVNAFIDTREEAEPIGNCTEVYFWYMPKYSDDVLFEISRVPEKIPAPEHYWLLASNFMFP